MIANDFFQQIDNTIMHDYEVGDGNDDDGYDDDNIIERRTNQSIYYISENCDISKSQPKH